MAMLLEEQRRVYSERRATCGAATECGRRQAGYSGTLEVTGFVDASDNRYTCEPAYINRDEGAFHSINPPDSSPESGCAWLSRRT